MGRFTIRCRTLLALCAGLTAIRLAVEEKLEWAVAAIVFAALLDGIDGRVARMIKGQSKFGAELDSLADFVNFGVAPGLILYFWQLHELHDGGWIAIDGFHFVFPFPFPHRLSCCINVPSIRSGIHALIGLGNQNRRTPICADDAGP